MKWTIDLEETTIYSVEVEADSAEAAEQIACDMWGEGFLDPIDFELKTFPFCKSR